MVDVEQGALRPFEEHAATAFYGVEQIGSGVGNEWPETLRMLHVLGMDRGGIQKLGGVGRAGLPTGKQLVFDADDVFETVSELVAVEISEPDRQ